MIRTIEDIKALCETALQKTSAQKAVVFGSWARGTASPRSDLDILIVEKTDKPFFVRYTDFDDLYKCLDKYCLDLLIYTPKELDSIRHRKFIRTVLEEGVVIYER